VGLNSLKSLNLTKLYPNNNKNNKNNKVKSKSLELYELAGKKNEKKLLHIKMGVCSTFFKTMPLELIAG
jgi:hypothetical protein